MDTFYMDLVSNVTASKIIGRFPVQTLLGAGPGFGTQPSYEAPDDLQVQLNKRSD